MIADLTERLNTPISQTPPDMCDAPEVAYRRALDLAAAEGQRLRDRWDRRLAHSELEYAPVTTYALARPAADVVHPAQVTEAPAERLAALYADPRHVDGLAQALAGQDLRPLVVGATSVTFETTVGRLRNLFGVSPVVNVRPVVVSPYGVVWQPYLRFARPVIEMPPALRQSALLVDIEPPVTLAQSPAPGYLHVTPDRSLCDAVNCLSMTGYSGKGVGLAIIDTGIALTHPHFAPHRRQVRVVLVPNARFKRHDPWGHGTVLAAAVLAIAPGVDLTLVKMQLTAQSPGLRLHAADAIITAMSANPAPRVVVCAWGLDERGQLPPRWRTEILTLSARYDTLFVCAVGNGLPAGRSDHLHPANLDEVLAVGGAWRNAAGDYEASDFTASFTSQSSRPCPDIAGPSGPAPLGIYLMSPTDEVSYFDVLQHGRGRSFPDGDETDPGDGWCGLGGSSTAAAVVAGVAAIVRGAHPGLTAAETKDILMRTAADIPNGLSADKHATRAAGGAAPWAGGVGMVNCHAALREALLVRINNP